MPQIPPIVNNPPNMITLVVLNHDALGILIPLALHFPIMPESYMVLKQYLTTVTPTKGGGWVDKYGAAPSPVTIQGTFGYKTKGFIGSSSVYNGFGWCKYLEWLVDVTHEQNKDGEYPTVWLMAHNAMHYFEVEITEFSFSQTTNRNMLWVYSLKATILNPITASPLLDPVKDAVDSVKSGAAEGIAKAQAGATKAAINLKGKAISVLPGGASGAGSNLGELGKVAV